MSRERKREDAVAPEIPAGCEVCRDGVRFMPWVPVERNGLYGVERCSCARGRYLRSRDLERGAAQAAETTRRRTQGAGAGLERARVKA